jgi:hypothetical protein
LGFAGLDKVPPPPDVLHLLEQNRLEVTSRQAALKTIIPEKAGALQSLGIKLKSMEGNPHLAKLHAAMQRRITALAEEVRALRREYSENYSMLESDIRLIVSAGPARRRLRTSTPAISRFDGPAGNMIARRASGGHRLSLLLFGIVGSYSWRSPARRIRCWSPWYLW